MITLIFGEIAKVLFALEMKATLVELIDERISNYCADQIIYLLSNEYSSSVSSYKTIFLSLSLSLSIIYFLLV